MAKAMMPDLTEWVTASLMNPNTRPWFPDLTGALAEVGWRALGRKGLTVHNYGTARVLAGDASAPRNLVAYLPTCLHAEGSATAIPLEVLPSELAIQYKEAGVSFYTVEEITGTEVLNCLDDALGILKSVPTLLTTVVALVKALHVIKPESDDHDVSFSEPHIPFSIFVSAPRENSRASALRVAEAVVHEAMHLQLTLVERVVPLINPSGGKYFSPWRGEHRTVQGVLHALYVFRVIDRFLFELSAAQHCPEHASDYARERRSEISTQVNEINSFRGCAELTETGARFVHRLIVGR
jgi:HEXXH motif-containing protein